jgi:hypothetical protein
MRIAITALAAAALLVATSVSAEAGRGGPRHFKPHYSFNFGNHNPWAPPPKPPHSKPPSHHSGGLICEKTVIKIPKWTRASFGRHGRHGGFIIKIIIICHRPVSC